MKKFSRLFITITTCAHLISCAGLSKKQREQMTSIHLPATAQNEKAYMQPTFTSNASAGTIGFMSGFAGGIIGGVIAATVVGAAEKVKSNQHKPVSDVIAQTVPTDVNQMVSKELATSLKTVPFFQTRLTDNPAAPWKLVSTVVRHGLQKNFGNTHSPVVYVETYFQSNDPKKVLKLIHSNETMAKNQYAKIEEYAANPKMLRQHYEAAAHDAVTALTKTLEARTKSK
ncbi:MAG: hypothetical protein IPK32_20795 [Verrucomicrobiaceae bacterium]|nr:hypothetical protein [Verrucomicrobiaceae bacterium]